MQILDLPGPLEGGLTAADAVVSPRARPRPARSPCGGAEPSLDHPRNAEEAVDEVGRGLPQRLHVSPLLDRVRPEGLIGSRGLRRATRLEPLQLLDVLQDRRQLAAEALDLLVGQLQAGQPGDLPDVFG